MKNELHQIGVTISRKQMMDLIINQKDIVITSKMGQKITLAKPDKFVYSVDPKTRLSSYVVTTRVFVGTDNYLGIVTVKTEDNKIYTGTLTYHYREE